MARTLIFRRRKTRLEYFREMLIFSTMFAGIMTSTEQLLKLYFYNHSKVVQTNRSEGIICPNSRGSGRRDCFKVG
jgi:hypothetical protein